MVYCVEVIGLSLYLPVHCMRASVSGLVTLLVLRISHYIYSFIHPLCVQENVSAVRQVLDATGVRHLRRAEHTKLRLQPARRTRPLTNSRQVAIASSHVYTMQPVVRGVVQRIWQLSASCVRTVYPLDQPVVPPVVSCRCSFTVAIPLSSKCGLCLFISQ